MMTASDSFQTETHNDIQQLARQFAQEQVAPVAKTLDVDKSLLKTLWVKLSALGLTGLQFSEEWEGAGLDDWAYLLALIEISKASASLAVTLSVHTTVGILPILLSGTPEQKQCYLPPLITGEKIAAFALTEPDSGSDAANGQARADKNTDNNYIINGSKIFTTNANIADIIVATAKTGNGSNKHKSHSAFLISKPKAGKALVLLPGDEKLGLCGSDWANIAFDNLVLSESERLGPEGDGFKIFMECLNAGRVSIAAISIGIAQAALAEALKYAKARKQFGQSISSFQAIQFKLADMATEIEAAMQLLKNAAQLKMAGITYSQEASMAKLYASEMSVGVTNHALQIFGGYGYTKDFPVERYWRDARAMPIVEGTSEIQHLVIARHLL